MHEYVPCHYITMSAEQINTFIISQLVSYTFTRTLEIAAFASLIVLLSTSFILSLGATSSRRDNVNY